MPALQALIINPTYLQLTIIHHALVISSHPIKTRPADRALQHLSLPRNTLVPVTPSTPTVAMAPVKLNPHTGEYCRKISFDYHDFMFDPIQSGSEPYLSGRWNTLPKFPVDDLQEGDLHGCRLCEWILDSAGEDARSESSSIESNRNTAQISFALPGPKLTLRELLKCSNKRFQECCLCVRSRPVLGLDLTAVTSFGLWDLSEKRAVLKAMRTSCLFVQCSRGESMSLRRWKSRRAEN